MIEIPEGWNKTLDDLSAEGGTHSGDELEWAREYERRQLRSWARFPKVGDKYEALESASVIVMTSWAAPFSGGEANYLPVGTVVRVAFVSDPEAVGISADPVDAETLERQLVSKRDRRNKRYGGFSLVIKTAVLNTNFRLVRSGDAV